MTQTSFLDAVRAIAPDLRISDTRPDGPTPEGYVSFDCHLKRVPHGVELSIRIGKEPPRQLTFASEEDAGTFIGGLYAAAGSAPLT